MRTGAALSISSQIYTTKEKRLQQHQQERKSGKRQYFCLEFFIEQREKIIEQQNISLRSN